MHPHTFYSTLFYPKKRDEVFVVMSFAAEFDARWSAIIEPTIRDDLGLEPNRVDFRQSGESVVHDILDGIAHARLIIADITSIPMKDGRDQLWPQRNGNVMWEVGVAHTMRLPDEVVLIRSDNDPSIFDLTQFRAFQYDPLDVPDSRRFIKDLANDRLKLLDQSKSDFVERCAKALDPVSVTYLLNQVRMDGRPFAIKPTMRNAILVPRLFDLGILCAASYDIVTQPKEGEGHYEIGYQLTPLGQHVISLVARQLGLPNPLS